jgi:hypothetical protein
VIVQPVATLKTNQYSVPIVGVVDTELTVNKELPEVRVTILEFTKIGDEVLKSINELPGATALAKRAVPVQVTPVISKIEVGEDFIVPVGVNFIHMNSPAANSF